MSKYSFDSVDDATSYLIDFFKIQQVIWDHMHDLMQYNNDVIDAMGIVSKYVCDERNKLMNKDPKHSITLDDIFED